MNLIITGGGTGGHLFPGIAVAKGMQQKYKQCTVMFIGTNRLIDQKALTGRGFRLKSIQCSGIKGMGFINKVKSALQLPLALFESLKILSEFKPHLVFGVGGYVTGPVLLAAWLKKIPICIHEQNSVPGLANKITAKLASKIFLSIPCNYPFPPHKTVLSGNPIREEILTAANRPPEKNTVLTILVLGGSQGAHRVNQLMTNIAGQLNEVYGNKIHIIHQTGVSDENDVRLAYQKQKVSAEVKDFFHDMAHVYRQADLVVSRAGATTLAELSIMGLPVILIPFPYAADNHQEINGAHFVKGGGARMFSDKELTDELFFKVFSELLHNREELHKMARNMKKLSRPEATENIINECVKLTQPIEN